ncbi:MAG: carboxylating nicotinate-nucleotide diphosphorylase [Planctomycetota bacterium]
MTAPEGSSNDPNALGLDALWASFEATGLPGRMFELSRDEDLGADHASLTVGTVGKRAWAGRVVFREEGVVAGLACVPSLLGVFPGRLEFKPSVSDGQRVEAGEVVGELWGEHGPALLVERTLLNLVARLSGIATRTSIFVDALEAGGGRAELWDTRKTTPGLRLPEKYAVRCGGGKNHRLGLHDALMIKDNFLGVGDGQLGRRVATMLDGVDLAVRGGAPRPRFIEVEVDRLGQLDTLLNACGGRIDAVLLDNMDMETLAAAVLVRDRLAPRVALEASGGVSLGTIGRIGATGVDRVSVGSLTHGAASLDVGLDAV